MTLQKTFFALGTVNSITISDCGGEAGLCKAMERVMALHKRLSVFDEVSDISRINAAAGKRFVEVHPDTLHIIKTALRFSELSGGAFDITSRPLTELWGIGKKGDFIPSPSEVARACSLVDYMDIEIDDPSCSVMLRKQGQALDLGGIAKGFAADEVKRILTEQGTIDAVINLGGTVIAMGAPRMVGIRNPFLPAGAPMGSLQIKDSAVVTSGLYEKFFIKDGVRYHHIIDPQTGYPADSGLCSITIIGDSAMELDALTTAVFVSGIGDGSRLVDQLGLQAVFVSAAQNVLATQGLRDRFSLLGKR